MVNLAALHGVLGKAERRGPTDNLSNGTYRSIYTQEDDSIQNKGEAMRRMLCNVDMKLQGLLLVLSTSNSRTDGYVRPSNALRTLQPTLFTPNKEDISDVTNVVRQVKPGKQSSTGEQRLIRNRYRGHHTSESPHLLTARRLVSISQWIAT